MVDKCWATGGSIAQNSGIGGYSRPKLRDDYTPGWIASELPKITGRDMPLNARLACRLQAEGLSSMLSREHLGGIGLTAQHPDSVIRPGFGRAPQSTPKFPCSRVVLVVRTGFDSPNFRERTRKSRSA